ncbi:MAG: glutamine--fructose-6-phosphate aminotransferase, partial [Rhodospirillaceae bacterium]|nr:glutamine--fructose-6-phosphate aminotransferase [Rhodospirillaceae bacterium]
MCGIIGIIGKEDVAPRLLDGLKRLEYRGYDSAGVATLVNGTIERRRAEGKLSNLDALLADDGVAGTTGIGHTRWATHGVPNETNAHPHATDKVAIVHNGIIENFQELRDDVVAHGHTLVSETDTEVVVHLITRYLEDGATPAEATRLTLARLVGAFSLGIVFAGEHDLMIAARRGTPLAIGFGDGEMFLGSDALALALWTDRIMYLEDGDWAVITGTGATVYDGDGGEITRNVTLSKLSGATIGRGGYRHFMLKEIYEQPQVIGDTLHGFVNPATRAVTLPDLGVDLAAVSR